MRTVAVWLALLLMSGCASREIKVDCGGKLLPINAPSGKAAP